MTETTEFRMDVEKNSTGVMLCLQCVTEAMFEGVETGTEEWVRRVNDASTWAPTWVTQEIGGQTAMACVSVPTCLGHVRVEKATVKQMAARSGLALPETGYR